MLLRSHSQLKLFFNILIQYLFVIRSDVFVLMMMIMLQWLELYAASFLQRRHPTRFIQHVYLTIERDMSFSVASLTRVLRRASGETAAESLLHEIASWWLFACGILYSVAVSALSVPVFICRLQFEVA